MAITSLEVLHLLRTRETYERFSPFIQEHLVGKEAWAIIQDMEEYYSKKSDSEIKWSDFADWFLLIKHPIFKPAKAQVFRDVFDRLDVFEPDEEYHDNFKEAFISKDYAMKIGEVALSIAEGSPNVSMDDVNELWDEYELELKKADEDDVFLVTDMFDPSNFDEEKRRKGGFNWRLPELQEALGTIVGGDFLMFASYPGSGKTTMLASEVTYMAEQMGDDDIALWFNNEQGGDRVMRRIQQAALGMSESEIVSNPVLAKQAWDDLGIAGKIKFYDKGLMYSRDVERMCKKYKPKLIVIDQLWKIHGFEKWSGENMASKIGLLFNWGREIAKEYNCPVITVHQADATAHGQKYVEMDALHQSKIAVQGEMDALCTIGRPLEAGQENIRGLYTPKNKLTGKEDFKAEVIIDTAIARYVSPED